jgi:phosphate transport system permease protein
MNSQNYENAIRTSLKKRYAKETRLKFYGIISISFALSFLAIFLYTIFINGYTALQQTQTLVSIQIPSDKIMNENGKLDIKKSRNFNWGGLVKEAFRTSFPEVNKQTDKRNLNSLVSENAGYQLRLKVENGSLKIGNKIDVWIKTSDDVDMLMKGHMDRNVAEKNRRLSDQQIEWVDKLKKEGKLDLFF